MKKSILLAFFACFSACVARAEVVTPAMAMAAADTWAERNERFGMGNNATNVITVCDPDDAQIVLWHQVSMAGGGCLIIAPVTEIEPVVMALEKDPGELPAAHPLRGILTYDMRGRLRFLNLYSENRPRLRLGASTSGAQEENDEAAAHKEVVRQEWAEQQQTKWDRLIPNRTGRPQRLGASQKARADDGQMREMVVLPGFQSGGPLTHWNQNDGIYDRYTPGNVVCGCVATAAAAMMQYFRVGEKTGQEIESGKADSGTSYQGASYPTNTKGGKYDWASRPKSLGGDSDEPFDRNTHGELLGRVTFDAGVAVGMSWNKGGSGASEAATATAFINYFGFKEARCVNNPKPDQYDKLIYAQVRAGAPVGMGIAKSSSSGGHSVVAVGYGIDEDDVERVRVFLGWGGSGDGWYALPYINTASTYNGPEDLYDILDTVITMIGYENDFVVPVYGRFIPYINPDMTIGVTPVTADGFYNTNGYFGARVSASGTRENREVEITCMGKSYTALVGPYASCTDDRVSDANAICKWVPDPIMFPLLNSEVALSFSDARQKCIDSITNEPPKPVLAFSGTWGKPATDAAWEYLYWLDTNTVDGVAESFTNKYIILCVPYSLGLSSESDGNPSFGIFDGRAISAEENKIWSFYNGRIAYWSIGSATYTNDVDGAGFPYTNVVETADGPFVTYSYTNMIDGVSGAGIEYVTGELITNELIRVMEVGLTNFLKRASGISLTVEHNCPEPLTVQPEPDYGFYENIYTNGITINVTSPEYATNSAGNVEFKCLKWVLSSTNTPEVVTNELTVTDFTPARDGSYTITWLWETNAVKITRELAYGTGTGTITPDKGDNDWYKIGDVVTFTATGAPGKGTTIYTFNSWVIDGAFMEDDEYSESGNLLVVKVAHPATIRASFSKGSTINAGSFGLTVTNYGIKDGDPVPETLVGGVELPYETITNLNRSIPTEVMLATDTYTDVDGKERTCLGWQLANDDGKMLCELAIRSLQYTIYVEEYPVPVECGPYVCIPTNFVDICKSVNGGGLVMNEVEEQDLPNVLIENGITADDVKKDFKELGFIVYKRGETSPLSFAGINPNFYGITNGASVTLTWLWELPPEPDDDTTFDIVWNETLDNLHIGYVTNLLSKAEMEELGVELDDLTVTAPAGWIVTKSLDADGNAIATLSLDTDLLQAAMDSCTLTIEPKSGDDGKLEVKAYVLGVRGFWYVLYGSDDLATWEKVTSGTYESGTPAAQGQGTAEYPISEVNLSIIVTPGDTAAGVKRFYKVVTGATQDPLAE